MTRREVMVLAEKEKKVHLNGLLLRRTKLANPGRSTLPLVGELAKYSVKRWVVDESDAFRG
jgi:hypothetical protein